MFEWVLNGPMALTDNHFSNSENFKVEKVYELDMTGWQIGDKDALCGLILFLLAIA